ncbi:hypothetical protein SCLCIDRAFT_425335 [Scleroderma citrinum Foug A]|uniref:Uncharacterized protein n=1 Tax=Scleroderma citrinum Foug A TaxID=1036808 RepID=A0A0C3ALV6_9AGAM|nr:hypothetical protein SCLCIDRAFT_425335 [Scleroderma citrinum Foug A]
MSCELPPGSGYIHDISHGTKRGNTRQVAQTVPCHTRHVHFSLGLIDDNANVRVGY